MNRHKEAGRCDCGGTAIFHHSGRDWCTPACLNAYMEFTGSTMRFDWAHGDAQRRFAPMKDPSHAPLSGFRYVDEDTLELRDSGAIPETDAKEGPSYHVKIEGSVTKTIVIGKDEVESEEEAIELAHQLFTLSHEEGVDENYNQKTIDVTHHE